jgi:hypothetical protein
VLGVCVRAAIKRPLAHSFNASERRAFVESSIQGTSFCVCAGGVGVFCIVVERLFVLNLLAAKGVTLYWADKVDISSLIQCSNSPNPSSKAPSLAALSSNGY